jgi:5,10-methylenetetrahydromethanopterin reductase
MKFGVGVFGNQPVATLVRQVQLAEDLGYDTAWIVDSQLICRELYVTLTACLLATKRIKLGTGVIVPFTRHPSVNASALLTLNELAEGRMMMGVGSGDSAVGSLGLKPARIATLSDMVGNLRDLMSNKPVNFTGEMESRVTWLDEPADIPIYIAASGPRMLEAAGRLGDGVIMHSGVSPWILEAAFERIRAGAGDGGVRAFDDLDIICWAHTSISDDRQAAREHVRGRVTAALRHPLPVEMNAEDQAVIDRVKAEYDFLEHASADARHRDLAPDRFIDLLALAGTPEEVRDQVRQIMTMPEIAHIVITPQVPGEGFIEREAIFRMFAEGVIAQVT